MTPIDPERYAVVLAHVGHFPRSRVGEVLRRLRIDQAAFDEASGRVPSALGEAAAAGDIKPALRFREALEAEKARLARERPTVEMLGELDDEPAASEPDGPKPAVGVSPLATEETTAAEPAPPAAEAPKYVPSYLRSDLAKPSAASAQPSAPRPIAPPGQVLLSVGQALPAPSDPALAPTAPPPPALRTPIQQIPQAVVPHVAVPVAQPAVVIQHVDEEIEPSVDSTLAPIPAKVAAKPLPFREGRGAPPPTVALPMPTPRGDDEGGETIGIAGTIVPTAATPFEEAALERWTVEAYARFVADRRIDPADQARAAYGLANTAEESALLVHMNKRFGSDPALLRQWQQLVAARLKERGRS
jgi:hypothetical protein